MARDRIEFKCPTCSHTRYEEIMVDVVVASDMTISELPDGFINHCYGDQTNEDGRVDRYQCKGCGFVILDDSPANEKYTQDGLDERALAVKLKELAAAPLTKRGDLVCAAEIVTRLADGLETLSGEELVEIWNEQYPSTPIVYEGDSLFWIVIGHDG